MPTNTATAGATYFTITTPAKRTLLFDGCILPHMDRDAQSLPILLYADRWATSATSLSPTPSPHTDDARAIARPRASATRVSASRHVAGHTTVERFPAPPRARSHSDTMPATAR